MTNRDPFGDFEPDRYADEHAAYLARSLALSSAKLWEELAERLRRLERAHEDLRAFVARIGPGFPAAPLAPTLIDSLPVRSRGTDVRALRMQAEAGGEGEAPDVFEPVPTDDPAPDAPPAPRTVPRSTWKGDAPPVWGAQTPRDVRTPPPPPVVGALDPRAPGIPPPLPVDGPTVLATSVPPPLPAAGDAPSPALAGVVPTGRSPEVAAFGSSGESLDPRTPSAVSSPREKIAPDFFARTRRRRR